MRYQNILVILTAFAAIVSIPAVFIILLQVLEPPPVTVQNLPYAVETNPVVVGQAIIYDVSRCAGDVFMSYPFIYGDTVELVEEDGSKAKISLPSSTAIATHPGCEETPTSTGPIPLQVEAGKYHLEGTVYSIGRFRISPTTFLWSTESFEVVSRDVHPN